MNLRTIKIPHLHTHLEHFASNYGANQPQTYNIWFSVGGPTSVISGCKHDDAMLTDMTSDTGKLLSAGTSQMPAPDESQLPH